MFNAKISETMKKGIIIASIATFALTFASCGPQYLDQYPQGSTITEKQYLAKEDAAEGSVRGIYTRLYDVSDHDAFGQRSIDMYGDLLCGDMAMKARKYGWFSTDELMQTSSGRRSYIWSYYYNIIRLCNKTINALDAQGRPQLDVDVLDLTEQQQKNGMYFAEVLTIRGWAYAGLLRYFSSPTIDDMYAEQGIPIYDESVTLKDDTLGAPRASVADVYDRLESDLQDAIEYFDVYNIIERSNKMEMNIDVARCVLAFAYLNKGDYTNALKVAKDVIDYSHATLLSADEVLTTGFNNIASNDWLWGKDVTVDNYGGLASFFGQCDIYSYSYAYAGDVKGIDANLYKQIEDMGWDKREAWFNKYYNSKANNYSSYQYAPDGKFYSATSTKLAGDRDWLSDDVYMRLELAYLIAAEAACRLNDDVTAKNYLFEITDRRVKEVAGATITYTDWQNSLASHDDVLQAIRYNWRVELWGEGYGLQTFRRFGETVALGDNHLRSTKNISPTTPSPRYFTFEIPTAEYYDNPNLRSLTELAQAPQR